MVARPALFLALILGLLSLACGGSDSPDGFQTAVRTPTPRSRSGSGPTASVDPRSGPPGIQLTVTGSGWPARASVTLTGETAPGKTARPYANLDAEADGSFTAKFRLEKTAAGDDLQVGRYDLIARSGSDEVHIPFLVEVRRPIGGGGPGPGG